MADTVSKERRREISNNSRINCKQHYDEYNKRYTYNMRENQYTKYMMHRIKANASKTGTIVTITEADLNVPEYCPALGILLDRHATRNTRSNAPSVDRIDNDIGYVPGNVVVVSLKANRIKNDATIEELEKVLDFYKGLQQ